MQNYIVLCLLENVYHRYLFLHTGAARMAVVVGITPGEHYLYNSKKIQFLQETLMHYNMNTLH